MKKTVKKIFKEKYQRNGESFKATSQKVAKLLVDKEKIEMCGCICCRNKIIPLRGQTTDFIHLDDIGN